MPSNDDRTQHPEEPTREELETIQQGRVARLRHHRFATKETRILADRLEVCTKRRRCDLGICPHCATEFKWAMVRQVEKLWPPETPLTKVTAIPMSLQQAPGELSCSTLKSTKRHLRRIFEKADVTDYPLVGFIDVSFNVHSDNRWEPHWQPHLVFITPAAEWCKIAGSLAKVLPKCDSILCPLIPRDINDFDEQVSYVFKPWPTRRTSFDSYSPKAYPSKQNITAAQEVEFMLWLGDLPPSARLFMLNVRQYGNKLVSLAS